MIFDSRNGKVIKQKMVMFVQKNQNMSMCILKQQKLEMNQGTHYTSSPRRMNSQMYSPQIQREAFEQQRFPSSACLICLGRTIDFHLGSLTV